MPESAEAIINAESFEITLLVIVFPFNGAEDVRLAGMCLTSESFGRSLYWQSLGKEVFSVASRKDTNGLFGGGNIRKDIFVVAKVLRVCGSQKNRGN